MVFNVFLRYALLALGMGCGLAACSVLPPAAAPEDPPVMPAAPAMPARAQPAPLPAGEPQPPLINSEAATQPVEQALRYAQYVRSVNAFELAQEIARLGEPAQPLAQLQLALALQQTHAPADALRAANLLQRLASTDGATAAALQPLAQLLLAQLNDQRRADEQIERQALLLRDNQRRIDQLTDRLEALRALERSMPGQPRR